MTSRHCISPISFGVRFDEFRFLLLWHSQSVSHIYLEAKLVVSNDSNIRHITNEAFESILFVQTGIFFSVVKMLRKMPSTERLP